MVSRKQAWAMWLIASIFYAYQFLLRVTPSIMIDDIMIKFNIDVATFGKISGIYYIGYSLMHIPLGILLDRYGAKRILPIFILITVIGMLPFIYADFWVYPFIGRALIGIGSSAAILGAFNVIRIGFAEKHFSRMLSFSVTIGLIGAIYGGGPLNYLTATMGFIPVMHMLMLMGIILSAIAFFAIPNTERVVAKTTIGQDILQVATNVKIISICILAGLMIGPMEGFADVWGTSFLKIVYHMDENLASYLPSLIFIGMCFGAPIISSIADKTGRYYGTIITSSIVMCICFILMMFINIPIIIISIFFLIIGFLCSYQILAIYKASTYATEHTVGLTTACANMIIMAFGALFHTVIGKIINNISPSGNYSIESFIYGLSVIPIGLLIGAIGFIIIVITEKREFNGKEL